MSTHDSLTPPSNLTLHQSQSTSQDRQDLLKQKGAVFWMTGLSGSGKSTTAMACEKSLIDQGYLSFVLDGDNIRSRLNADLSFSASDRKENLRRVAECARLFAQAGLITFVSFISPTQESRNLARSLIGPFPFYEVYLSASLEVCESRDPKGLYRKARSGEIQNFTGISAPYEAPQNPDLILPAHEPLEHNLETFIAFIRHHQLISSHS